MWLVQQLSRMQRATNEGSALGSGLSTRRQGSAGLPYNTAQGEGRWTTAAQCPKLDMACLLLGSSSQAQAHPLPGMPAVQLLDVMSRSGQASERMPLEAILLQLCQAFQQPGPQGLSCACVHQQTV